MRAISIIVGNVCVARQLWIDFGIGLDTLETILDMVLLGFNGFVCAG